MHKRIVFTREDGKVSVCAPTYECIRILHSGQFLNRERRDIQIERHVANGLPESVAVRWVDALIDGGQTTSEAFGLIAARDCHGGHGIELWDTARVSRDRWFRDAWRRSKNGGPIFIDLDAAREIQASRIAVMRQNYLGVLRKDMDRDLLLGRRGNIAGLLAEVEDLDMPAWGRRLTSASTPEHLQAVWPEILPVYPHEVAA